MKTKIGMLILLLLLMFVNTVGAVSYEEIYNNIFEVNDPATQEVVSFDVVSPGKLIIQNISLENMQASVVTFDGETILNPFQIEIGMAYTIPFIEGQHDLEFILHARIDGQMNITILQEMNHVAYVKEEYLELLETGALYDIRFETLPEEIIRDNKTGLIWHQNPVNPGFVPPITSPGQQDNWIHTTYEDPPDHITMDTYINNLNSGVYGTDPMHGNAGFTDWRIPTIDEMMTLIKTNIPHALLVNSMEDSALTYGDPFCACNWYDDPAYCPEEQQLWGQWITQTIWMPDPASGYIPYTEDQRVGMVFWDYCIDMGHTKGCIWPVRGHLLYH